MDTNKFGTISDQIISEEICVEWSIPDFFSSVQDDKFSSYRSPDLSLGDVTCFLKLNIINVKDQKFIYFTTGSKYLMKFRHSDFSLKSSNGYVFPTLLRLSNAPREFHYCNDQPCIMLSELLKYQSEVAPSNVVTVVCTLKYIASRSTQPPALDKEESFKFIRLERLSENFKDVFGDSENCDVTLKVKDQEYKAHRVVLIAQSTVFAAMFRHNMTEKQKGIITIPDCDPDSFLQFLKFLYCGKLKKITVQSALNLYEVSDKYDVQQLKEFCVDYLLHCSTIENFCEIVVLANKYNETELLFAVQDFFNKNVSEILVTSVWERLMSRHFCFGNKLLIGMPKVEFSNDEVGMKRKICTA